MIKQIILPLIGVALFIVVVGVLVKKSGSMNILQPATNQKSLTIGTKIITIEVAKTESDRAKGLSGRATLSEEAGMLFAFEAQNVTPSFWMKDMLIPLDIIWINDGHVAKIDKNVPAPAPGTSDNKLKIYNPGTPVDYVLEVNAGFSDKNNIKAGDPVILPDSL